MKQTNRGFVFALLLFVVPCVVASAGPFDFITKPIEQAANVVVKAAETAVKTAETIVTAPVTVVEVIVGEKSLDEGVDKFLQPVNKAGEVVEETADLHDEVTHTTKKVAGAVAGDFGESMIEVATTPQHIAAQSTRVIGQTAQGEEIVNVVGVPVAAKIRSAKREYEGSAKPMPVEIRKKLEPFFDADVLDSVRYTVNSIEANIAAILNMGNQIYGELIGEDIEHAVTLDNIIVFSVEPDSIRWWAHEVHHVAQYAEWGIEEFARRYSTAKGDVEGAANQKSKEVMESLRY